MNSDSLEKFAERTMRENVFDHDAFLRVLWAGRLRCPPPVCGERFKKGWWCSRDENHDGPCAAYRLPTRWQRVRRAIGTFFWAYAPRVHIGPCCKDCWEC